MNARALIYWNPILESSEQNKKSEKFYRDEDAS